MIKCFQASREDWGRGNLLGTLPEENFQFGQWKPVENSIEDDIQTTTTHKPLAQKRDFPIDSKFQIQSLDLLHKYADQLYNKNIPRTLQPIAQKRVAVYIKPLGELGDLPQSAPKLRRSSGIQNGHQIDPESLYTMPYDNVGIQEPWRPTSNNNSYSHSAKSDKPKVTYKHMPKDTNKLTLNRMPKNEDLGSKPFGDTVLQASLSVSGNKPKKPKNSKKIEKEKEEQTSTELSTSSNQKYYYYPTSFPSNRNPYPAIQNPTKNQRKRPRAEINLIKPPQNHKRYIPASVVSERKDVVSNPDKSKSKTVYYHTPQTQETLIRPERNCKFCFLLI